MGRPLRTFASLILLIAATGPVAAQEPAKKKVYFSRVRADVKTFLSGSGTRAEKAWERLERHAEHVTLSAKEARWLRREMEKSGARKAIKPGIRKQDLIIGGKKLPMHTFVPNKYNPRKKWPLVLHLHGGGGEIPYAEADESARSQMNHMLPECRRQKVVLVAPGTTDAYWVTELGGKIIEKALDVTLRELSIDQDRVALAGSSLGGFGTFHWAPVFADRFALAAPMIGGANDFGHRLANCRHLPFYVVLGLKDHHAYMIPWVQDNVRRLKKLEYDVTFKEYPDMGHDVPAEDYRAIVEKLVSSRRKIHAHRLTRVEGDGLWYWVEASGKLEVDVTGHLIDIKGPTTADLFLADDIVDLDQPVTIKLNGKTVFSDVLERSLKDSMDHFRRTRDPSRFCARRLTVSSK